MSGLFNAVMSNEATMTVETSPVCEPSERRQGQLGFPSGEQLGFPSGELSAIEEQQILEKVRQEIRCSKYRAIRRARCGFHNGVLTLSGSVPNFHYKQIAQEVVRRVSGIAEIQNCLEVDYLGDGA